jgi:hypothetical protein
MGALGQHLGGQKQERHSVEPSSHLSVEELADFLRSLLQKMLMPNALPLSEDSRTLLEESLAMLRNGDEKPHFTARHVAAPSQANDGLGRMSPLRQPGSA